MFITKFQSKLFGSERVIITDFPVPFHRLKEMANYDNEYEEENKWQFKGESQNIPYLRADLEAK